jgi:hypothetical protein
MNNITLRRIFCHLTGDKDFLSTVIETKMEPIKKQKIKKSGFNLMANVIIEYNNLSLGETQPYNELPNKIKFYLTQNYVRLGVKNVIEKNLNAVNISFLASLNVLLRPELAKVPVEEQVRNVNLLETFIEHKIHRNYQIDKLKNTRKVQAANKVTIGEMTSGKITHNLIKYIVNIFEINLVIFDLSKSENYLYWAHGTKYPYMNLFRNLYFMTYIQGNYEPLICTENWDVTMQQKAYANILSNSHDFKPIPELQLGIHTLYYIDTWNLPETILIKILENYYCKPVNTNHYLNMVHDLEKPKKSRMC